MKNRIMAMGMALVLLLSSTACADTLKMLDTGDDVLTLKETLTAIGYLDKDGDVTNVFDKPTKDAIEELQSDFGLEETGIATPEIQVICTLLEKLSNSVATEKKDSNIVIMPDVIGLTTQNAVDALKELGLYTVITEGYNDVKNEGTVYSVSHQAGYKIAKGSKVTLHVSKGPSRIESKQSTITYWHAYGSQGDNYEFESPYIYKGTLYIKLKATINSTSSLSWRGYGTASVTDKFDKVVPIRMGYEEEQIKKGETQKITLLIPTEDLDTKKPTTLSVKLELYRGSQKKETQIRMDFTIAW